MAHLNVLWQLFQQLSCILDPDMHIRYGIREHQLPEPLWMFRRYPLCKHPAPRMTNNIVFVLDPQVLHKAVELNFEKFVCPERLVASLFGKVCRPRRAELVVEDNGNIVRLLGKGLQWNKVVMRKSRTTMKYEKGRACTVLEVADDHLPCLALLVYSGNPEWRFAFDHWGSHFVRGNLDTALPYMLLELYSSEDETEMEMLRRSRNILSVSL
jgi:hypothetical protein